MNSGGDPDIPIPVRRTIVAADGYMDLKMHDQARETLGEVPAEFRNTVLFLTVRRRLATLHQAWAEAAEVGARLCGLRPGEPGHWIRYAYAVRRAESLEKARAILLSSRQRFPRVPIFAYNLACYECRLGNLEQARTYLSEALEQDPDYLRLALDDEDLLPLHDELRDH